MALKVEGLDFYLPSFNVYPLTALFTSFLIKKRDEKESNSCLIFMRQRQR